MSEDSADRVTDLLRSASTGNPAALEELFPLVYAELKRLARSRMSKERPGQTLQPTALVHETYLRLVGNRSLEWDSRGHFFAAAAEAMRRILIERARAKAALKRGGDCEVLSLSEWDGWIAGEEPRSEHLLALDDALVKLERLDPGMAQVVKLRYFAGLSVIETASTLQLAPRTVGRHWVAARAWLLRELREVGPAGTEHGPA